MSLEFSAPISEFPVQSPDHFNYCATFLPADPGEPGTLPCLEIGGVQVYAYVKSGRLRVSETADPALQTADGRVVPRITVGDRPDLFTAGPVPHTCDGVGSGVGGGLDLRELMAGWREIGERAETAGHRLLGEWVHRHRPDLTAHTSVAGALFSAVEGKRHTFWSHEGISVVGEDHAEIGQFDAPDDPELTGVLKMLTELRPPKHDWDELYVGLPPMSTPDDTPPGNPPAAPTKTRPDAQAGMDAVVEILTGADLEGGDIIEALKERLGGLGFDLSVPKQEVRFEVDGETVTGGAPGQTWVAVYQVPADLVVEHLTEADAEELAQGGPRFERLAPDPTAPE